MKITLEELEVFLAVVDAGSLTAAAQQMDVPVSTISRVLGRLEEKLFTTLLRRTTRRLDLTDEGCSFLKDARVIVSAANQAQERLLQRHGQPSGPLKVDAATPFLLHAVVPLIPGYRQQFPLVDLELTSNEGFVDLLERRIDLALRIGPMRDSTLHSRLLCHCRLRLLASPAYLQQHGQPSSVAELESHTLLGFSQPSSLNQWPLATADGTDFRITPDIAAISGEVLRHLALADQGIVCLADFMTVQDRAEQRLIEVLPDSHTGALQPINAVYYRQSAVSVRVSSFVDYLSQALRAQPWALMARQRAVSGVHDADAS